MRTEMDDPAYIADMLEASKDIRQFLKGVTRHRFLKDKKLQAAVERKIEIIGEAARKLTDAFKESHGEIPWRPIIAMRNIVAHDYGDVQQEKMWLVAEEKIPELISKLKAVLPPLDREDSGKPAKHAHKKAGH